MELITSLTDKRLGFSDASHGYEGILHESLKAALEERDKYLAVGLEASDTAIRFQASIIKLERGLAAALSQLAEKEGQVCRARDYLSTIRSSLENVAGAFIGYIDVDAMIKNLDESSP